MDLQLTFKFILWNIINAEDSQKPDLQKLTYPNGSIDCGIDGWSQDQFCVYKTHLMNAITPSSLVFYSRRPVWAEEERGCHTPTITSQYFTLNFWLWKDLYSSKEDRMNGG